MHSVDPFTIGRICQRKGKPLVNSELYLSLRMTGKDPDTSDASRLHRTCRVCALPDDHLIGPFAPATQFLHVRVSTLCRHLSLVITPNSTSRAMFSKRKDAQTPDQPDQTRAESVVKYEEFNNSKLSLRTKLAFCFGSCYNEFTACIWYGHIEFDPKRSLPCHFT